MTSDQGEGSEVYCPNCGEAVAPDDRFCQSCGTEQPVEGSVRSREEEAGSTSVGTDQEPHEEGDTLEQGGASTTGNTGVERSSTRVVSNWWWAVAAVPLSVVVYIGVVVLTGILLGGNTGASIAVVLVILLPLIYLVSLYGFIADAKAINQGETGWEPTGWLYVISSLFFWFLPHVVYLWRRRSRVGTP